MIGRFTEAQADGEYEQALAEIRAGAKTGHWIWYILPQLAGLGHSSMSRRFGIRDEAEAREYVNHPVLGPRLLELAQAVLVQLERGVPLDRLMGSRVDALKLVSSMTLFGEVSRRLAGEGREGVARDVAVTAHEVLALAEAQGYEPCRSTIAYLR